MTKRKEHTATAAVGRASYTPAEVASRNSVSVATIYNAINAGRLRVANLGGGVRGALRITPEQEQEWLVSCSEAQPEQTATAS